jgi:hypothetical protein
VTVLAVAFALAGCRGGGGGARPSPSAEPSARATAAPAAASSAAQDGGASAVVVHVDPLTLKLYRVDLCLFASLGLRHLREAYLASLHGAPPGPGRVPSFDAASHVDHERQARTCALAASAKQPPIPEIDGPLASFGPLMGDLAEEIEDGSEYYALKQHERDAFAKGKAIHEKLAAHFTKLDEGEAALAAGVEAYRAAHPVDPKALPEGERAVTLALDAGRALVLALVGKADRDKVLVPLDGALGAACAALAERAAAHPEDPWSRAQASIEAFRKAAGAAAAKPADTGAQLAATNGFATALENAHHARAAALLEQAKKSPR